MTWTQIGRLPKISGFGNWVKSTRRRNVGREAAGLERWQHEFSFRYIAIDIPMGRSEPRPPAKGRHNWIIICQKYEEVNFVKAKKYFVLVWWSLGGAPAPLMILYIEIRNLATVSGGKKVVLYRKLAFYKNWLHISDSNVSAVFVE